MEVVVCKYFQSGFCKFQEHCRKQHVKELCETDKCTSKVCIKRHPKVCKYFKTQNACKFNELCAYQHTITTETSTMEELVNKINTLANTVKVMSEKIYVLENILKNKSNESKESTSSSKLECEQCSYHASSTTVLKRHITTKHPSIEKPEVLRELDSHKPLHLNQPTGERGENSDTSQDMEKVEIKCEYKRCDFISNSSSDLENHIKKKHTIDASFKYPISTVEVECMECDEIFLEDDNFALHAYYKHLYSYDCIHCHKHLPGESLMYEIHLKMCQAPCGGHPLCPCKF